MDVDDPNGIGTSMTSAFTPLSRFGGRFLVCGGRQQVVEGQLRSQCVVLEFPSFKAATDCYHSPEYQEAAQQRQGRGRSDLILIEGIAS